MAKMIPGRNGGMIKVNEKGDPCSSKGRPPGALDIKNTIRKYLAATIKNRNPLTDRDENIPALDAMTLAQISRAIKKNDTNAFNAVLDRADGKPVQKTDITTNDESLNAVSKEQFQKILKTVREKKNLPGRGK
jgi:hypothetical protein